MTVASPLRVERVAAVDGGAAGAGIAQVLALAGYQATFCGDPEAVAAARTEVDEGRFGLRAAVGAGRIGSEERRQALARLRFDADPAGAVATAELVICTHGGPTEATAERLARLEATLGPEAVLACNSEGAPVTALGGGLRHPERLVGWHWGRPTPTSKLAEIVQSRLTSAAATETVVAVARRAGKNPVVIADAPEAWGYVTNRIWSTLREEASRIVDEGVAGASAVDQLMVDGFGWPSGPFGRGGEPR